MDTMTTTERLYDTHPDAARHLAQKLHVKKEDIEMVRKFYLAEPQGSNEEERSVTARVSTPDVDRDGEIILSEGIDVSEYQKNPVLCWAHRYEIAPIGKALWAKADKSGLICKFQFAPTQFADEIYQLYKGGYMRAFSIGFIPLDYDKATKTHKRISLLEVSAVPVPANSSAVLMEAYEKGIIKSASLKKDFGIEDAPATEAEPITEAMPEVIVPLPENMAGLASGGIYEPEPVLVGEIPSEQTMTAEAKEPEAPAVPDVPVFDAPVAVAVAPEVKAEGQPIDVTLQLLTAVLAAIRDVPAALATEMATLRQDIADLRASIPLLIVPARPEAMGERDAPEVTLFELQAAVGEIKASIEEMKAGFPARAIPEPEATVTPEPVPAPVPPTPDDTRSAVADFIKSPAFMEIVKRETTLALAKIKGRVEA